MKVIEEAIKNMIRRIEKLENIIKNLNYQKEYNKNYFEPTNSNFKPGTASKAQINYLRSLGGKVWDGMSKQEAGKGIDNALFNKKISKEIIEPKEVDTDDAGLDGELL